VRVGARELCDGFFEDVWVLFPAVILRLLEVHVV
jgi:hypothetical protein